jgi:hypothetical protein
LTFPFAKASGDKATSLETPKKSSVYLRGYASGFFVISALFRQNSQNAHDGTLFTTLPGNRQVNIGILKWSALRVMVRE